MIPFFQPFVRQLDEGHWYLAEDFAFCDRARQCGYAIRADTTIRLWHIGTYRYGWEDAGKERERFDDVMLNLGPRSEPQSADGASVSWRQPRGHKARTEDLVAPAPPAVWWHVWRLACAVTPGAARRPARRPFVCALCYLIPGPRGLECRSANRSEFDSLRLACGSLDVVCAPASMPALANDAVSRGDGHPLHRIDGLGGLVSRDG